MLNRVIIRDVTDVDIIFIQQIYAGYVSSNLATFEEDPPSSEEIARRKAAVLSMKLPYLIAEVDGRVAGYCYATSYRPRPAYRHTVENSVYVHPSFHRCGIGSALLRELILRCEAGPWRQMIAVIGNSDNKSSIMLHSNLGFRRVGTFNSVGFKLGKWVDTVLMQRSLGLGDLTLPNKT